MLGLCVLVLGLVGLARGRLSMLRVGSRRGSAFVIAAGLMLSTVGAVLTPTMPDAGASLASAQLSGSVTRATGSPASSTRPAAMVASAGPTVTTNPVRTSVRTSSTGAAFAALAGLRVKGRGPRTGYDRGLFGQAWFDADRNGCDTRNDVLRRDLSAR